MRTPAYIRATKSPISPARVSVRPAPGEPFSKAGVVAFRFGEVAQVHVEELQEVLVQRAPRQGAADPVVHPSPAPSRLDETHLAHFPQMSGDLVLRELDGIHQLAHAQVLSV